MSRRNGRVLAVQALYSYDVGHASLDSLLEFGWVDDKDENGTSTSSEAKHESFDFARLLISGTINNIEEIDKKIKSHLSGNWNFDRLNRVTLSILRMSVFSLLYQKDLNPTIVIDEAIAISKEFGTDDSFKFINAILDTISKEG